jgi:hypothetical protein
LHEPKGIRRGWNLGVAIRMIRDSSVPATQKARFAMSTTGVTTKFSFLASGPTFETELPGYFDPLPEMATPLMNGNGGRAFYFVPYSRYKGFQDDEVAFLRTVTDRDGRPVEVYKGTGARPVWVLRWSLSAGVVTTHLREIDGDGFAEVTADSIAIVESENGLPFLLPEVPLRIIATSAPGFQEEAEFFSADRGVGWSVMFQRPGLSPEGVVLQASTTTSGFVAFRAGLGGGVDVRIWTGYDAVAGREAVDLMLESFRSL